MHNRRQTLRESQPFWASGIDHLELRQLGSGKPVADRSGYRRDAQPSVSAGKNANAEPSRRARQARNSPSESSVVATDPADVLVLAVDDQGVSPLMGKLLQDFSAAFLSSGLIPPPQAKEHGQRPMSNQLLPLYSLKYSPFTAQVPVDALYMTPVIDHICWHVGTHLVNEGGFALASDDPDTGKNVTLRLVASHSARCLGGRAQPSYLQFG